MALVASQGFVVWAKHHAHLGPFQKHAKITQCDIVMPTGEIPSTIGLPLTMGTHHIFSQALDGLGQTHGVRRQEVERPNNTINTLRVKESQIKEVEAANRNTYLAQHVVK